MKLPKEPGNDDLFLSSGEEVEHEMGDDRHFDNWEYNVADPSLPPKRIGSQVKLRRVKNYYERT